MFSSATNCKFEIFNKTTVLFTNKSFRSPLMVKFTQKENSFSHFLVNVCGIIGGIFTVAGLVDGVLHKVERQIRRKMELGKFT